MKKTIIDNNLEIYNYLNPNDNDILSNLNGYDLQDLLFALNGYYIEYRKYLGFDDNITFGMEIEAEKADKDEINIDLAKNKLSDRWKTTHDVSLNLGIEIVSPILYDRQNDWNELFKVCKIVNQLATIDKNAGGHIHIGSQILEMNKEYFLNLIKIWSTYENIIYRFLNGDHLIGRPEITKYASMMSNKFWKDYELFKKNNCSIEEIIVILAKKRYQAINFENIKNHNINENFEKNTLEFRSPNGTLDPIIWQNNLNMIVNLILYCKDINFNYDIIEKRHNKYLDKYDNLYWYNEIYIDQALELIDLIFTNNLDKINFLRQYLKSFEMCNSNNYKKSKKFTKNKIKTK